MDSIELHTPDIVYRATSIGTPAIDDPAIDDPAIDDPAIDDPAIDDPAIDDPAIDDPAIDDPAIDDPAIDDPAIDDPAIDDPAIDDPAIDDASVAASSIFDPDTSTGTNNSGQKLTQITWKVALKGNTTTSMTSKVFLAVSDARLAALKQAIGPGKSQLLVSRRYRTSDRRGTSCAPVRVSSYQVIANVVDPVLTNNPAPPDLVNPVPASRALRSRLATRCTSPSAFGATCPSSVQAGSARSCSPSQAPRRANRSTTTRLLPISLRRR